MRRGFGVLVVLIVAAAIVLGGVFFLGEPLKQSSQSSSKVTVSSSPNPTADLQGYGVVSGKAEISPTCGGAQRVGEVCSKPFQGTIRIKDKNTQKEVKQITSDQGGNFSASLAQGTYILEPVTAVGIPGEVPSQEVVIVSGKTVQVNLLIDTGIR